MSGQTSVGGTLSTIAPKVQDLVNPFVYVAVAVTLVLELIGNVDPEGGLTTSV